MVKNQIQFQKGLRLMEFLSQYGTEEQCHDALFEWRWPEGFVCANCEHTGHCEIASRGVYQCYQCHHQTSVISGTIFEHTKLKGFRKEEIAQWAQRHLPRYLAELCYRFNRRFKLEAMIPRRGYAALRTPPMPQRLLGMAEARGQSRRFFREGLCEPLRPPIKQIVNH